MNKPSPLSNSSVCPITFDYVTFSLPSPCMKNWDTILHSELKACVLALLKENNKGCKMDTHTHKLIAAGDRLQYAKTR